MVEINKLGWAAKARLVTEDGVRVDFYQFDLVCCLCYRAIDVGNYADRFDLGYCYSSCECIARIEWLVFASYCPWY